MLLWLFRRTNLTIVGGYTSNSNWTTAMYEDAWVAGWGLALFDHNGPSGPPRNWRMTYYQYTSVERVAPGDVPAPHHPGTVLEASIAVRYTDHGFLGISDQRKFEGANHPTDPHNTSVDPNKPRPRPMMVVLATEEIGNPIEQRATSQMGAADAASYMGIAAKLVPHLSRFVLYIDNESPPSFNDFHHLVDYYKGFYSWLETQPAGDVTIRPGIYAHLNLLGELLQEFPYLYICDVDYGRRVYRTVIDPESTHRNRAGLAAEFFASRNNAIPSAGSGPPRNLVKATGGRGPKQNWLVWPAVWQWEGNNTGQLSKTPAAERVDGFPIQFNPWGVDYDSALVDDPAYPSVSPRLTICVTADGGLLIAENLRVSTGMTGDRAGAVRVVNISAPSPPKVVAVTH